MRELKFVFQNTDLIFLLHLLCCVYFSAWISILFISLPSFFMSSTPLSIYPLLFLCLCTHISTVCVFFIYKGSKNFFTFISGFCSGSFSKVYLSYKTSESCSLSFTKFIYRCHIAFSSLLILKWSKIWKWLTCSWIALDPSSVTYLILDLQLDIR